MLAVRTREIIAGDAMLLPGGSRRPPLPTSARPCLARQVAAPKQSRPALQARAEYRWQRIDARLQLDAETLEHHRQQVVAADGEYDEIGRAHVRTPVTNAHLVCRLLL